MRTGANKATVEHSGGAEEFDRVVLATHSDVSLRLRGADASAAETAVLAAIPYADNDVYLHRGAPAPPAGVSCMRQVALITTRPCIRLDA